MAVRRSINLVVGSALWALVSVAVWYSWRHAGEAKVAENSGSPAESTSPEPEDDDNGRVTPKLVLASWSPDGLPDFELLNQANEKATKKDFLGQPWVASFIFTRCAGTCPRVTTQLKMLQDKLKGVPVRMVSFSVQPEKDTPEVLARYAENMKADTTKWSFLTGDIDVIHRVVAEGFRQYVAPARSPNPEPGWEVEHSNNVCLVNAEGVVIAKYNSLNDGEMAMLRKDINKLIANGGLELKKDDAADESKTDEPKPESPKTEEPKSAEPETKSDK